MAEKEGDQKIPKPDQINNEAELIGRIIQSEQKLSEYFTTVITKSVTEQIERRNMARLRLFGVVSVVLVSVIIPAVTLWIRGTIVSQTETAIQEQFSHAIEQLDTRFADQTKQLEQNFESFLGKERNYLTFANYALYLADRSQVPESELINVLSILEKISNEASLTSRPDFPFLVDLVVRTTIKHSYVETLHVLEDRLQTVITSSSRTMPRLARYYGESIIGDRFTSERKLNTAVNKFRLYLDRSETSPEFVRLLPLQLMVERRVVNQRAEERVKAIQLYVKDLPPTEQAAFIAETIRYSNPDYRDVPATSKNRRIAGIGGRLVVETSGFYADMLQDNAVQAALTQLAYHEANLDNMGIAMALTAFRRVFIRELSSGTTPGLENIVRRLVRAEINPWLSEPVIIDTLRSQNSKTEKYSREHIQELERKWQDEFDTNQHTLIAEVQDRVVSRYLKRVKLNSLGMYHEILLMDGVGLLAGASDPNDDYWQGDEPKWLETYRGSRDALHIRNLKFDESALAWEIQISLPVVDPDTGNNIGAVTIGLDPSALVDTSIN